MTPQANHSLAWNPWLRRWVAAIGFATLLLGFLVIIGWHTGAAVLLQVRSGFVAMQYTTALNFITCGLALVFFASKRRQAAGVLGALAASFGSLAVLQGLLGLDLGVDHLSFLPPAFHGHMPLSTALCFLFFGGSLAALGLGNSHRIRPVLISLAASGMLAIGTMSLFGYFEGMREIMAWGKVSSMAVHTGIAMNILSLTLFALAWRDGTTAELEIPDWLPIPVTAALMISSVLAFQVLRMREAMQAERMVQSQVKSLRFSFKDQMDQRVLALQRMAMRIAGSGGLPPDAWEADASMLVAHSGGYEAVELVDRDLIVRRVAPLHGNESALGLDIKENPKRKATFESVRAAGQPVLTTSVALAQKGLGYFLIVPISDGPKSPGGFVVAVLRGQPLVADLLSHTSREGYVVSVLQDTETLLPWKGGEADSQQETTLPMYGREWRIIARPTAALLASTRSGLPAYVLSARLLVAGLVGITLWLAQKARRDRLRLAEAADEMHRISARQAAILASANAAIIATGADRAIQVFNHGAEKMLGFAAAEVLGKHGAERFLDPADLLRWAEDVTQRPGITRGSGLDAIVQSVIGGKPAERECTYLRKDGTRIPVFLSVTALSDEAGNPAGTVSVATDLTQRKQIEQTLLEREARFRMLIENGSDVISITDAAGVFRYLSPSVSRVLGWSQEEMLGQGFPEYLSPDEIDATWERYQELVTGPLGGRGQFLSHLVTKDGTYRVMDVQSRNQIDNPLIAGVVSVLRDVTDRIKAEEGLSRERDFSNAILETVGALVLVADWEGRIARFNRACEVVTGFSAVEVLGHQYWEVLVPEALREQVASRFLARKASDYPCSEVSIWVTKGGEERHVEWSDTVLLDEEGQPEFVISTGIDVTERNRAAEALRRSEERIHAILEHAPMILFAFDRAGVFTMAEGKGLHVMNLSTSTVVGKSVDRWKEVLPELREDVERALSGETFTAVRSVPGAVFENWYGPLKDEAGSITGVIGVALDITEKQKVEKLKSEFVSTVSHELRTPLTSIRGALGLLAGGVTGAIPDPAKGLVDIALKNSERLGRLINDILDIEKIESGKVDFTFLELDLRRVIEQSIEANRGYGETLGVGFELGECPEHARVLGDEDRLMQVLANLLSNAAKFSPRGETVTLSVEPRGSFLRVGVRDRGPGIAEEFKDRIFQRFAQADASDTRQRGGTGLGLAVSKAIVERHHGHIGFENEAEGGTTFFFELPGQPLP